MHIRKTRLQELDKRQRTRLDNIQDMIPKVSIVSRKGNVASPGSWGFS